MIQSLFILNDSGNIVMEKHWRGVLNRSICDFFWEEVTKAPSKEEVLPVISTAKHYLIHIYRNDLFFLSVVNAEFPPLLVLEFLHRLIDTFKEYFNDVSEEGLKSNFVTVVQLLDEMMDNGFPMITEPNILKDMILQQGFKNIVIGGSSVSDVLPENTVTSIPWRKAGVKYTNNEIYLDIIEEIDLIQDPNGQVVWQEVSGDVQCTCHLSGMPDLVLIFQNPKILDDCSFHPCVRYNRYEKEKVISFVPPDGVFHLLKYRVSGTGLMKPIFVKPEIKFTEHGGTVNITVGPQSTSGKALEAVMLTIPFPDAVASTSLTATHGAVDYDETKKILKWDIGKISSKSPVLSGTVTLLPGASIPEMNPIIQVDFKITMFSASGIKVESLTLFTEKYKPYKGVRSVTKAGKYQIRT